MLSFIPPENTRKLLISDLFRGYKIRASTKNRLIPNFEAPNSEKYRKLYLKSKFPACASWCYHKSFLMFGLFGSLQILYFILKGNLEVQTRFPVRFKRSFKNKTKLFKRQRHKMVRHTQTIRCLLPTNCLSVIGRLWG